MTVVVPFVPERLRSETRRAVPGARLADVSADGHAYWRLVRDLWADGETFVLVEHDVVPRPGTVEELLACPADWCAFPYHVGGDSYFTAFGFTKFAAPLLARHPEVVSSIPEQYRDWLGLDGMVLAGLRRWDEREHVHGPPVRHLRTYPSPGRRRSPMTRLRYVGDGRYLNGVPAVDHETDDPETIAIAVESGLYEVAGTASKRRTRTADAAEAPAVEPAPEAAIEPAPEAAE